MDALKLTEEMLVKRKRILRWFAAGMVIPMLIYVLYFFISASDARMEQIMLNVSAVVSEQSIRIDSIVRSVDRQVISATLDYNIQRYLHSDVDGTDAEKEALESYLMGLVKSIQSTDNVISSVYIWLGEKQITVLSGGIYPTEAFVDCEWLEDAEGLQSANNVFTSCRTAVDVKGQQQEVISGIWAIRPRTSREKICNYVVINFSKDKLTETISQTLDNHEELFVLNSKGQEVMGNTGELKERMGETYKGFINHNQEVLYSSGDDYIAASVVSTYTDWTYLLLSRVRLPILPDRNQILGMLRYLWIWMAAAFILGIYLYRRTSFHGKADTQSGEEQDYRYCTGAEDTDYPAGDWEGRHYYLNSARQSVIAGCLENRQYEDAKKNIEGILEDLQAPLLQGVYYSNTRIVLYLLLDMIIQAMQNRRYRPEAPDKSFDEIYREMNQCRSMADAAGLVTETLEIYRRCLEKELLLSKKVDPVDIMVEYINENYDKDIKLKMFAEMTYFSESHLSRMFKTRMGENYLSYLMKKRVEAAKYMLRETDMKVSEIASALSFNDSKTFIRTFEKYEHTTPGKYRHNARMQKEEP